jgi:excisionase family DNA binding protein
MDDSDTYSPEELLPIGETARRLGVSVDTVRRWERDGLIKATRTLGGQRRFTVAEVESAKASA